MMSTQQEVTFIGLAMSLYYTSWGQMGKVANPLTGKIERNLEQAKTSIDTLVMLREKTKGNLTKDEEKALQEMIANLQMNYVDELNKPEEKPKEKTKQKSEEKPEKNQPETPKS